MKKREYKLSVHKFEADEFLALMKVLRINSNASKIAAESYLVKGMNVPDSAAAAGCSYQAAQRAIDGIETGFSLVLKAAQAKKRP
jgi:hypothetical protein